MRAHLVQLDIAWEDKECNYRKVEQLVTRADPDEGDLVVLPEMFDTGFSLNIETTADKDGATLKFLMRLAGDLGVFLQGARTVHACHSELAENHAVVIAPSGEPILEYAKIHPFSFGRESERFQGGREVVTYRWEGPSNTGGRGSAAQAASGTKESSGAKAAGGSDGGLTVCPAICYDLRFPELFRMGLAKGAELHAIGANWPEPRQQHWRALLVARAIENQTFVLGVNRTGNDPNLKYIGGSIALGPKGEVLGELGAEETVLSVEIDPREVRSWREKFPAWRDVKLIG
jgi:omega-amidase